MHEVFEWVFLVLGAIGLANMVIAPWVHAWKLRQLSARIEQLEIKWESDGGDDPDDGESILEENNVVGWFRVGRGGCSS